jgi:exoribonuclease-2
MVSGLKKTFALSKTSRGIMLGIVLEQSSDKAKVLLSDGRIEVWGIQKIVFLIDFESKAQSKQELLEELKATEKKTEEIAKSIDTKEVWDVLADEQREIAVEEISALLFQNATVEQAIATARALALDCTYFRKGKKQGHFVCASRQFVHDSMVHEEREKALDEHVNRVFLAVSHKVAKEAHDTHDLETGVKWLKDCALGKDCEAGKRLLRLLCGREPDDIAGMAFQTLLTLGYFHEDEILGVHRLGLSFAFPSDVEQEAHLIAKQSRTESQQAETIRWSGTGPIAIDDQWTTEVDDALLVEAKDNRLCVHVMIADPSALIPLESSVARQAHLRAETLYLPTGKFTMFPSVLSEGVLSLNETAPAPVLDLVFEIEPDGKVLWFDIRPTWAVLERRLTYDEVDRILETQDRSSPYFETLNLLNSIAQNLRKKRREAGALIINRDEVVVRVENGEIMLKQIKGDSPARTLVQEFMILACTHAGLFAKKNGIPVVYRKQDPPDLKDAGKEFKEGSKAWRYKVLRTMKRAELSSFPEFHYGMGVVGYTQVTSPLRRFQDFVVHVQLKRFLCGKKAQMLTTSDIVRIFGEMENRIEALGQVKREAKRYFLLKYLKRFEGQKVLGEVIAVEDDRVVVELQETLLEVGVRSKAKPNIGELVSLLVYEVHPRQDKLVLKMV